MRHYKTDDSGQLKDMERTLADAGTPVEKIGLLQLEAKRLKEKGNREAAIHCLLLALDLSEKSESPVTDSIAGVHNNLALIYRADEPDKSLKHFKASLKIIENETAQHPDQSLRLAHLNYNLAELYFEKHDHYRAKKHYKKAIEEYSRHKKEAFRASMARSHYQLGMIYYQEHLLFDARLHFTKAIEILRALAESDSFKYSPFLAAALNNLASVFLGIPSYEKAVNALTEAGDLYQYLSRHDRSYLSFTLNNLNSLAVAYAKRGDYHNALEKGLQLCSEYENLFQEKPEKFTHYLATAWHNCGVYALELKAASKAVKFFGKALELRRPLCSHAPVEFTPDTVSTLLNKLEGLQILWEDSLEPALITESQELLEEARLRLAKLSQEHPAVKNMQNDCDYYADRFQQADTGELAFSSRQKKIQPLQTEIHSTLVAEDKIPFQQTIVDLLEVFHRQYPDNTRGQTELIHAYNDLSWYLMRTGKLKDAAAFLSKAKENGGSDFPEVRCNEAHLALLNQQTTEALQAYRRLAENGRNPEATEMINKDLKKLREEGVIPAEFPSPFQNSSS
ncbi:tetratricopeptide repeat protein [Robertkochia aurantiaca]|uniref:tetratricopeptide repeat protein n=1 Tax=Robertkochia aurantiaca TaxID=2873700 RepID=UPI001CCE495E|nr:tetratricopeptide repeat protein [Robertkochia sp. 3YJGBD-33]